MSKIEKGKYYCIINDDGSFWDNYSGWVELYTKITEVDNVPFTLFSSKEKESLSLLDAGKWIDLVEALTKK